MAIYRREQVRCSENTASEMVYNIRNPFFIAIIY